AEEGGATPHADDPPAATGGAAVGSALARAVVGDQDLQVTGPVADRDRHARRAGVADGVGDGLLQDAVGGLVDSTGQLPWRGGHLELDVQAGLARPPRPLLHLAETPGVGAARGAGGGG